MKHILLLLTGGTIGSQKQKDGTISLKEGGVGLADLYKSTGRKDVVIDTLRVCDILSENASLQDITAILAAVCEADIAKYSGIIIAYGTDTLAYAANLAAMSLPNYPITVVFVASDKPLHEQGANGLANLAGGIDFICECGLNGIYVCYQNPNQKPHIHLASRLLQAQPISGDFISVLDNPFGYMDGGYFVANPLGNPKPQQIMAKAGTCSKPHATPNILYIAPYIGIDYRVFDISAHKPQAVVAQSYHSGTASATGEGSLAAFIMRCKAQGIPVVLASYPYKDNRQYAPTKELQQAGGIMAHRMSSEAAYAKVVTHFAYPNILPLQQFLDNDMFFEIID